MIINPETLEDIAETLEHVRQEDGAPRRIGGGPHLLELIRNMRDDRDAARSDAAALEDRISAVARLVEANGCDCDCASCLACSVWFALSVPRCQCCGCFSTRHKVDDGELRGCGDCDCTQLLSGRAQRLAMRLTTVQR